MDRKSDVVIVGAGIVGLTAALALANEGFSVLLVEAKTPEQIKRTSHKKNTQKNTQKSSGAQKDATEEESGQPDIRAIALAQSSWEALAGLGSWQMQEKLSENSSPIWDMRIVEAHPLRGVDTRKIHLSHKDLREGKARAGVKNSETGDGNANSPLGSIVEGQALLEILYEAVVEHGAIEVRHSTKLLEFEDMSAAINVTLQNAVQGVVQGVVQEGGVQAQGRAQVQAKLLLACDGRNSRVRERAGISCRKKDYRQKALVCSIEHQREHSGVAVEWFTPSGTFASLPLLGRRSGIVWCDKHRNIERLLEVSEEEFIKFVRVRFGAWLGEIRLASKRVSYPIELLHARRYVAGRVVLLGDAAHSIHPLAGQGLNLGLRDVFALVGLLKEGRYLGQDLADGYMLSRYEGMRRYDARKLICLTDGLNRLFANDSVVLRQVRLTGMAMVDRLGFVKRAIVRGAA